MLDIVNRTALADIIVARLAAQAQAMNAEFGEPNQVPSAVVDDLLPTEIARRIYEVFPASDRMMAKVSLKERKFVAAQMDAYAPLLEEIIFAFQDPRVVRLVSDITGLERLEPDTELYAGGISLMAKGGFLRPHLDNSHDRDRRRYRVLNLLYYVTPDWSAEFGGSLQLWDQGPRGQPRTLPSVFNRLILMATNRTSWHSVNEIRADGVRCCVSNYYFSPVAPEASEYFHATSFRSEPGQQPLADLIMRGDNALRTAVLKTAPNLYRNPHVYERGDDTASKPPEE